MLHLREELPSRGAERHFGGKLRLAELVVAPGDPGLFRRPWKAACTRAGVAGTLFHDLRRSAVRNMDRAGVSQLDAMAITGHKTLSVYRRYRIVDEADIGEALARTQASLSQATRSVTPLREALERG